MRPSEPERVGFTVQGYPAAKGSFVPIMVAGQPRVIPQSSQSLREWTRAVVIFARQAMGARPLFDGPLRVYLLFSLPQAKSNHSIYPVNKRTDIDKLERSSLDALTDVVISDDGFIVDLQSRKRWALGYEGLPHPGARIVVERLPELASMEAPGVLVRW